VCGLPSLYSVYGLSSVFVLVTILNVIPKYIAVVIAMIPFSSVNVPSCRCSSLNSSIVLPSNFRSSLTTSKFLQFSILSIISFRSCLADIFFILYSLIRLEIASYQQLPIPGVVSYFSSNGIPSFLHTASISFSRSVFFCAILLFVVFFIVFCLTI